ncbi:MAG: 7-cyano-7-deazaguanine synthase QueC [Candidatus Eisenbacteria bacterium]|uniref:7-cyano-7-deazaguanine synthase n=1 Tax=Eiseniibacteriota bacterium TaxID=2212470 RepID=A0A538TW85_UNCEI|nr:MAG: 7-cyano-7-deazaguanine synthase QueC [Candidatus Eisenbacteria bacterium]
MSEARDKAGHPAPAGPSAVVLLSGGLDSATSLAWAIREGFRCISLAVDYGQRHRVELAAARRVARAFQVDHREIAVDLRAIGGSALTGAGAVPKHRSAGDIAHGIPVTYVPARNTVFLALALGLAETLGASDLVIGVNALDYSGYPDCRPPFIAAFEALARLATKAGVEGTACRVHAPLLDLDKAGIVRLGASLGVDFALTHSCYDPGSDGAACGACDSCLLRAKGFREAGLVDPNRGAPAPSEDRCASS